jgi:hypothetical protein
MVSMVMAVMLVLAAHTILPFQKPSEQVRSATRKRQREHG